MSHFPHGGFAAIQAAHEQQRRDQEEEEEMTRYTVDELDTGWEFKIVRSESGAFRNPEVFKAMLQEESMAGWELVEKLDNRRVRFKRPKDARRRDVTLPPGFDPYRSNYGSSGSRTVVLIIAAVVMAVGVLGAALLGGGSEAAAPSGEFSMIVVGVLILMLLGAAVVVIRRSK